MFTNGRYTHNEYIRRIQFVNEMFRIDIKKTVKHFSSRQMGESEMSELIEFNSHSSFYTFIYFYKNKIRFISLFRFKTEFIWFLSTSFFSSFFSENKVLFLFVVRIVFSNVF